MLKKIVILSGLIVAVSSAATFSLEKASPDFTVTVNNGVTPSLAILTWPNGLGTNSRITNISTWASFALPKSNFCNTGSLTDGYTGNAPTPNANPVCVYFPIDSDGGRAMLNTALTAKATGSYVSLRWNSGGTVYAEHGVRTFWLTAAAAN